MITSDCPIVDIAQRLTAESPVASPKNKIKVANLTLPLRRDKHFSRKEGLMNINRFVGAVVGVWIVRAVLNWTFYAKIVGRPYANISSAIQACFGW